MNTFFATPLAVRCWLLVLLGLAGLPARAQSDTAVYHLTIRQEQVSKAGKPVPAMTINGGIPGPTIRFKEGGYAVIYVKNEMAVETSVHWHGLLVPNFYDGVPYLTTPPIKPGQELKYEFPLKQAGTYWYHSHTMLQEQSGVYGSIVIAPKHERLTYDKDLVLVLSDWTNQQPKNVLRFLKRGSEWYNIRKGTATPLNRVIARGAFGAQLNFWKQRMEGFDIADVYYNAFLVNGQPVQQYPEFKPGEKVRLRIINGSSSTQFWMTFGGEDPLLVAADGQDVVPVKHNKTFIAVAETYDFLVTVPANGQLEFRAMAQDGSGTTSAYLGTGPVVAAPVLPKPDKIGLMQQMAKMDMRMGAPALKFRPNHVDPQQMKANWGMQMGKKGKDGGMSGMKGMKMDGPGGMSKGPKLGPAAGPAPMATPTDTMPAGQQMPMAGMPMRHDRRPAAPAAKPMKMADGTDMAGMKMPGADAQQAGVKTGTDAGMAGMKMDDAQTGNMQPDDVKMAGKNMNGAGGDGKMAGMDMFSEYGYDYLRAPQKTIYADTIPVREILLNLTGNMQRYIWSMNGVPLSSADKIPIRGNQITRITYNNLTMMHHPMHLHGHFFRVINENGEYSPLKHTVNVPPMKQVTIEVLGNEYGDWFLHCHILYHLVGGMARIVSYDTPRDPRLKGFPVSKLLRETNQYYTWGRLDAATHQSTLNLVSSNVRNQFNLSVEYGWNRNMETEVTYERYLYDYLRVFGGVNVENFRKRMMSPATEQVNGKVVIKTTTTAVVGLRFLTPYLFSLDARIDNQLRPRLSLGREIMIFSRLLAFGYYEYQADFGWVNKLENNRSFSKEVVWNTGLEYMLSRNFSLMGSYDNRFGGGGGLTVRF
ncbi:copper oxidase [Hymenobacter sp. UV11]|uniref:multicopper oxidase domain-containing protein n=1 Tax=Hymenobacter sp. UV11 TaxID=1849735 RepID=UPI001060C5F0|nr:multicopper oxidase domain-containing protein [Hymenobacter sp. UV11]TDN36931.1 copper oxidase [Hymenobacter sp. UV11]TFZ64314.1 copper oxidase [Hymenobacter sp. UV11]